MSNDSDCDLNFLFGSQYLNNILIGVLGTPLAIFSAISSFLLFLAIYKTPKLYITYRCQFLVMLVCDAIVAFLFILMSTMELSYGNLKWAAMRNFHTRLFPTLWSILVTCESISDFVILSVTMEIVVRVYRGPENVTLARRIGVVLSILFGVISQIPHYFAYKVSELSYCKGHLFLQYSDWTQENFFAFLIWDHFLMPMFTSILPLFFLIFLLATLAIKMKTNPEHSSFHNISNTLKLLMALALLRLIPDIGQKTHWALMIFAGEHFYKSFELIYKLSEVIVELTRSLSFFVFLYWDREVSVGVRKLECVRVFIDYVDSVSLYLFSHPTGWSVADYDDGEYGVSLIVVADGEMDGVEHQAFLY